MTDKLVKLNSYILYLLPIALVSGPFFSDLFLTITAINCIYFFYKKKIEFNSLSKFFFVFCIVFYIYIIIGSVLSENIILSLKVSFFYIRYPLFVMMVLHIIKINKNFLIFFFYSLLLTFLILTLDGYFQYIFGFNFFGYYIFTPGRISGFFNEELILGSFLGRLMPLLIGLYLYFSDKNSYIKNFTFALFIFFVFGLILITGERASFYLSLISIFLMLFLFNIKILNKLLLVVLLLFTTTFIVLTNPNIIERTYKQAIAQLNTFIFNIEDSNNKKITKYVENKAIAKYIASNQHGFHFRSAYEMFKDKPILGYGAKMYREICKKPKYNISIYSCTTHPHNTYLQLLAETGILGTLYLIIPLVIIIFIFLKQFFSTLSKKNYLENHQISFIICLFLTLFPLTTSGNFFNNWLSIIYFISLPFILTTKRKNG